MSKLKRKAAAILTTLGLALGTLLATGGTPAHAAGLASELYLLVDPGSWCVTPLTNNVGAEYVLGVCNPNAQSQWINVNALTSTTYELQDVQTGLCITYAYPNGHADGGYMTDGNCVGAQNQIWSFNTDADGGGTLWWLPDRRDNLNRNITLDNAGNNLFVGNHIDGSYPCYTCASESWNFPST